MPSLRFRARGPSPGAQGGPCTSGRDSPSSKLELNNMKVITHLLLKEPGDFQVPKAIRGCCATIPPKPALWGRGWRASEEPKGTALGCFPPRGTICICSSSWVHTSLFMYCLCMYLHTYFFLYVKESTLIPAETKWASHPGMASGVQVVGPGRIWEGHPGLPKLAC